MSIISRVGSASPLHDPQYSPLETENDNAVNAVRDRVLEAQLERPEPSARKVTNYQEVPEFSELFARLRSIFDSKKPCYTQAYNLSWELHAFYLAHHLNSQEKRDLFGTFEEIATKEMERDHNECYVFLKGALARHLHLQLESDPAVVESRYKEAARLGDECSWYYLGEFLDAQGRYDEAFKQFKACIRRYSDRPFAYRELAKYYQNGWADMPPNRDKSKLFYTYAIERGCVESAFNLAALLETMPCLTNKGRQIVIDYYKEAIEKGSSDAANNLGLIYQNGWYRTTEAGERQYNESYVNIQEAEVCFRKANELSQEASSAVAIAETVNLNSGQSAEEHFVEMQELAENLREKGSPRAVEVQEKLQEDANLLTEDDHRVGVFIDGHTQTHLKFVFKGLKDLAEAAAGRQHLEVPGIE